MRCRGPLLLLIPLAEVGFFGDINSNQCGAFDLLFLLLGLLGCHLGVAVFLALLGGGNGQVLHLAVGFGHGDWRLWRGARRGRMVCERRKDL